MTVVTDTSVVLNLCVIGEQEVLPVLNGRIVAPPIVAVEFQRLASSDSRFQGLTFPLFIEQAAPTSLIPPLTMSGRLQAGEIAALSLAVELRADAVLMDELAGRHAALSLGLRPVGLLGILLDAKERRLIPRPLTRIFTAKKIAALKFVKVVTRSRNGLPRRIHQLPRIT